MTATTEQQNERLFKRAREIEREADAEQDRLNETPRDTIQRLAFRIAQLERAERDEYGGDD